jgi:hypothetical protein
MRTFIISALCTTCFASAGQASNRESVLRNCNIASQARYFGGDHYDQERNRRAHYAACMTTAGERQ